MGAWGCGVFQDDVACCVRDRYKDLLGEGHAGEEATAIVLHEFREVLTDPSGAATMWLSLALTQWKSGRLEPHVKDEALRVLDDGSALEPWLAQPKLIRQRRSVLAEARKTLVSPQPPGRKIRKRFTNTCDWGVGELLSYRLSSGKLVVFRVIGHSTDSLGVTPVMELLDWIGDEVPTLDEMARLPVRFGRFSESRQFLHLPDPRACQIAVCACSSREMSKAKIARLSLSLPPSQTPEDNLLSPWRRLDYDLEYWFDVR